MLLRENATANTDRSVCSKHSVKIFVYLQEGDESREMFGKWGEVHGEELEVS